MNRPNILIIWTDQQRWDTIGPDSVAITPNLDSLAADGQLYANAFCNSPVCMPSRQSMLSGRYPSTLGVQSNGIEMDPDIECIQHVLSGHGYHTAQLGKLHFRNHASPYRDHRDPHPTYGFDTCIVSDEPGCYDDPYIAWVEAQDPAMVPLCRVDTPPKWTGEPVSVHPRNVQHPYAFEAPEELSHTAFVADLTCDYLTSRAQRAKQGEPFFAVAGIYAPHAPLNPPQRFVDLYDPARMALPVRAPGENFIDPDTGKAITDDEWRVIKQHYYALVSHVDDQVGRIIDRLRELDLYDDTLIVFTSDHGENLGDHGLIQKTHWYDSSTHVPLIVKPPAFAENTDAPGTTREDIVELVDVVPTITDYCGIPTPAFFQGQSLRRRKNGGAPPRESALIEIGSPGGDGYKAIRAERYLYSRHRDGVERLYDLRSDPDQLAPLEPKPDELLAEARDELLSRILRAESAFPRKTADY